MNACTFYKCRRKSCSAICQLILIHLLTKGIIKHSSEDHGATTRFESFYYREIIYLNMQRGKEQKYSYIIITC